MIRWQAAYAADGTSWVIRHLTQPYELGPWFQQCSTAMELAQKVNDRAQFCERIPIVPAFTPIPRPMGGKLLVYLENARGEFEVASSSVKC